MKVRAISWPKVSLFPHRRGGLLQTLDMLVVALTDGRAVVVPALFWSDGSSVPQVAWPVLRAKPLKIVVMGIVHDYAVRRGAVIESEQGNEPFTVQAATDLAVAVANYYGVSERDQRKIGAALKVAWRTYWRRRDVAWEP